MGILRDSVDIAKSASEASSQTPEGKEASKNLGAAAVTITKTINNALLPLAAVNFGFDKAREYFANRFESDLSEKTKDIPPDKVSEPKPSLAGPALQGLAFTHDEKELREMYLSLLASAMDSRVKDKAHPAFVEIIRQINSKEAQCLKALISGSKSKPVAEIRAKEKGKQGYSMLMRHLLPLLDSSNDPLRDEDIPSAVENFIRLGLIEVKYSQWLSNEGLYDWVEKRPEFQELKEKYESEKVAVEFQKGLLEVTEFGGRFADSVGIVGKRS